MSSAGFKPRERAIIFVQVEMPDFRLNEQTGDVRHDLKEPAPGHNGDALNLAVMGGNKLEMRDECFEIPPARERLRADHDAGELPLRRNDRFDLARKLLEVRFVERTSGVIARMLRSRSSSK
jgi:hypothetical protein